MSQKMVYAKAKNIRMSPRKVRLVIDVIRGKNAIDMSQKLEFINKLAAKPIAKVLNSAIANAKNNHGIDEEGLVIAEARVDEGITLKRGKAVSKGRYHRIFRRSSHIVIGLKKLDNK